MASDKKVAVVKKGNWMSSFLVVAALTAVGATGRILWKYQARLDQETPAPAAAPAAAVVAEASAPSPDPAAKPTQPAQVTASLPAAPAPAPAPLPNAVPIPIYAGKPANNRSVRGGIQIVGRNGTTSAVAPATAEDVTPNDAYANGGPQRTSDGPRIYTPRDPNRDLPPAPTRSGKPRYYDFDSRQSRPDDDDSSTFQRRSIVKQYR